MVQHHAARRAHYDLRLELDGVLRSWAVPKGPSPNPADKRLAVLVEDHPVEYASFEGRIPEGNYGAGAVILWDRGSWVPLNDPHEGLASGKLLFALNGYKLRGKWTLVKTKRAANEWLLIKERDGFVSERDTDAYPPDSILSGRTVAALESGVDPAIPILRALEELNAPRLSEPLRRLEPMLARRGAPFTRAGWVFEIKYDGYRLLAARDAGEIFLYSRAGNAMTQVFPEIAEAVKALPFERFALDGEVVVHDASGIPSFSRLQRRGKLTARFDIERASTELPATLYAFDLLAFADLDLRPLALTMRKKLLRELLPSAGPIRFSEHIDEHGEAMFAEVGELGLEGVVAKRAASPYSRGRSDDWVKMSAERRGDFAVIGYTDPKGSPPAFGALLLGAYEGGDLVYAGRVGSGFRHRELLELGRLLRAATAFPAPGNAPSEPGQHWCEPELVCEVKFKEVTPDGVLRHPVFIRIRDDKSPRDCERESFADDQEHPAPEPSAPEPERQFEITNPGKVFWPEEGYTKGDLIEFYRGIAPFMLPYLADRPLVLDRYPDGIGGKSFFQKDAPPFAPDWIRLERMWSEHSQREIGYFVIEDEPSLLYIINLGTIPLHVWSSRVGSLESPDWCILDLDPKAAPFVHVVQIAQCIHALCEDLELPNFVKTSGSSGLHVLIPLGARVTYEQSRSLGELLSRVVVSELPGIATITRLPSKREGKVYLDYVQNGHGRLLVCTFSVRPLPGAPVSMPLRWQEVTTRLDIKKFTIANAAKRMRRLGTDPMREVLTAKPDLDRALRRLAERFG